MLAVVLAAGHGKRLRPYTNWRSKAMLPIAGAPMLDRVTDMLEQGGVDRFVVVAHPSDSAMIEHLGRRRRDARVRLAYQERRLGMAQALDCATQAIQDDGARAFILASCDNIYPEGHVAALASRQREVGLDAAITLMRVRVEQIPTLAVVSLRNGCVTKIVEKPRPDEAPSDLGVPALYALSTRILDYLPQVSVSSRGEREFPDALRLLIEDGGRVSGVLVHDRMTLTCPADLLALSRLFLHQDPTCAVIELKLPDDTTIVPPVRIEAGVQLGPGCTVGPEVALEAGCLVGRGAVLRRAVVLGRATVESGAVVEEEVVG